LQPGAVLILLAGRFRGKRVILLKNLKEGALLVTGPFKINGVPLRRVNSRYVIATSTKVDISGLDQKTLDKIASPEYFAREKKSRKQKGEEAFAKQGEKPEVRRPHLTSRELRLGRVIRELTCAFHLTEEEARLVTRRRSEEHRQAVTFRHQERRIPCQLLEVQLQPEKRAEASRDVLLRQPYLPTCLEA
jgi:ribosomal protein L14E/L6E/L27E